MHSYIRARISEELLAELMAKTEEKAKKWGFNRHIVDFREAEKQLGVLEDYEMARSKARKYGLEPFSKHALIVRHEDINEFRFVETAFRNSGYNLRVFTEENEALDWIKK